jgi:hypothetical protein
MTYTRMSFLLLLPLAFMGTTSAQVSQSVRVSLASDCNAYALHDSITLNARVSNTGRAPVTLYSDLGWGLIAGLHLSIKDQAGRSVEPDSLDHDMPVPSTFDDRSYYLTLRRHQYFGTLRRDSIKQLFHKPGKYTLQLTYRSPISAAEKPMVKDTLVREDGAIVSSPVNIVVGSQACRH